MNNSKKIIGLIVIALLGTSLLMSCASMTPEKKAHPEEGYQGGFGGNGEHLHPDENKQ